MPLFGSVSEEFASGAWLLRGFVEAAAGDLLRSVAAVAALAPQRIMLTPGGRPMSAELTNCGAQGWISDRSGYRYSPLDPLTNRPWPALPVNILHWSRAAATAASFSDFRPDACLINCYRPGARMSLHQDKNERDFSAPIVSFSFGLPATFLFGGLSRGAPSLRLPLSHGDALVWGGPARLRFHGVLPIAPGHHELTGATRINLTVRQAA